jgi:transcriptional regulator GlxA family with amidase domain
VPERVLERGEPCGVLPARDGVTRLAGELPLAPDALLAAVTAEAEDEAEDEARAAVLDAALAPLTPEPPGAYLDLLELLDRMVDDRSLVRVEQVAALGAMSVRSLQRSFGSYVGVSPKSVLARYRLQDAAALTDAGEGEDLAAPAVSLGWFDQAHFSRDFRAVVGVPPSVYLRQVRTLTSSS